MKYQELKTKFGNIVVKDAEDSDMEDLAEVYNSAFPIHNIFQKSKEEILEYLKTKHNKKNDLEGFIVAKVDDKVIGGLLIRKHSQDIEGKHVVLQYNHIAVSKEHSGEGIGRALVNSAAQKIMNLIADNTIKTAKIELGVSENEKDAVEFFKKFGFEVEGKLKSHYRFGEQVYLLGKEIA